MPKILIGFSDQTKSKCAATSSANMKALIESRLKKDEADTVYTVLTLNTKMKLANVVSLVNQSKKALRKLEGFVSAEKYKIDPTKERKKWEISAVSNASEGE